VRQRTGVKERKKLSEECQKKNTGGLDRREDSRMREKSWGRTEG